MTQLDVSLALSDASTFLAIGKMCPLLEHVRLTTKIGHATSRVNAYDCSLDFNWNPFKNDGDDLISPEELESALHEWPKVKLFISRFYTSFIYFLTMRIYFD